MSSEHRNRTNKAQAIAAVLVTVGLPSDGMLDEAGWRIAALAGWHIAKAEQVDGIAAQPWTTVSDATRTEVRRLLAADEARQADEAEGLTAHEVDDVFAQIAAGSSLPRPAQDPDGRPVGMCDHVGTERVTRTAHGYLGDAPAGTVETLCAACGTLLDTVPPAPLPVGAWLAGINYGALPTEGWD